MGVGTQMKNILRDKKMTIKQLSEKTGISLNTLYSITKRDSERVDQIILQRIADALDVHVLDLIGLNQQFENYDIKVITPQGTNFLDQITSQYDLLSDENKTDFLVKIGVIPEQTKNSPSTAEAAPGELSKAEQDHIKKYRRLDPYGKEAVDGILDVEWRRCTAPASAAQPEPDNVVYITNWFPAPMSAGTGQPAGSDEPEELELTKRPPRGTSYVAPVRGDSMEPTYHDGDRLFIRACSEIEPGQVGVFFMDGQQWVKELGDGELISHNSDYTPIPMRDDIECQGLVLGMCDESYFE